MSFNDSAVDARGPGGQAGKHGRGSGFGVACILHGLLACGLKHCNFMFNAVSLLGEWS
jgi:hypothetical protein